MGDAHEKEGTVKPQMRFSEDKKSWGGVSSREYQDATGENQAGTCQTEMEDLHERIIGKSKKLRGKKNSCYR